jgi:hypothetical protein
MDAYELVEIVRKKPGFYLHTVKSLRQLHSLLIGYEIGAKQGICSDFRPFNRWLAEEFGLPEASGWCNMIITRAGSDEAAFDLFFELLDRFRKETRETKKD